MARRKKQGGHPNHERWLVSYADFITLLFAFFVVMFAVSQVDNEKVGRFTESVRAVTLWNGPPVTPRAQPGLSSGGSAALVPTNVVTSRRPTGAELRVVRDLLRERLRSGILSKRITIEEQDRDLVVRLNDTAFFRTGSDQLRAASVEDLRALGLAIHDLPVPVRVEGHTDSLPVRGRRFGSNWQLSAARAVTVLECLRAAGVDDARFSIAGYADKRPVASNRTAAGRQRNRRVDIVLLGAAAAPGLEERLLEHEGTVSGVGPAPGGAPAGDAVASRSVARSGLAEDASKKVRNRGQDVVSAAPRAATRH